MPEWHVLETAVPRYPDIEQISRKKSNFLSLQGSLLISEVLYLTNLCKNLLSVVKAGHGHFIAIFMRYAYSPPSPPVDIILSFMN